MFISPLPQCLWPPNLVGGELLWGAPTHRVATPFNHVVSRNHVTNQNQHISATTVPMVIKLGRLVTYAKRPLSIKSHGSWNTWTREIMRQIKNILSPLPQCLWHNKNETESKIESHTQAFKETNTAFKIKLWWVGAHERRKGAFSQGLFCTLCILYQYIECRINFQNIYTFTY